MTDSQSANNTIIRQRLSIRGRVQGVGFRPFAYRLAVRMGLVGRVGNDSHGAFIEIQGRVDQVEAFKHRLTAELPPLARITNFTAEPTICRDESVFYVETSTDDGTQDAEITPDMCMCDDCRRELFDPADRRYRYPFINCTNCGPRYSIIQSVPYDRPGTTMAKFKMCPACQAEYDDPANRRFHAQPNACSACGPRVWLVLKDAETRGRGDAEMGQDAIRTCAQLLRDGKIVAIKGLGGFHLACRADDDEVVAALRERKTRESKPLAIMVANLDAARALAEIDDTAAAALADVARPIVLVPKKYGEPARPRAGVQERRAILRLVDHRPEDGPARQAKAPNIGEHVAPGTDMLGLMLPYTPLHELLFAEGLGPLVMTSGNPTEEPLCRDNDEALSRLADIADAFLLHDRDIERRVDDSVVLAAMQGPAGCRSHTIPIRRARGLTPAPIIVPVRAETPVLAVGAELKSTVCVLAGHTAIVSEHLGELANAKAYRNFAATVEQFQKLLRVQPRTITYDLHPDYSSTRFALAYAQDRGLAAVGVQHHHAHIVSAMAENGLTGRVLGIACDGTGFGTDGAIWGCELMIADEREFTRAGHLRYFPLLGGDAAARETWRPAAALLHDAYGDDWQHQASPVLRRVSRESLDMARARLSHAARLPMTSSLGRLFDAVAFLLGLADANHHEAQAAMALEAAARTAVGHEPLTFAIQNNEDGDTGPLQLDVRPMIREMLAKQVGGQDEPSLAWAFHATIASGLAEAALLIARRYKIDRVVLSGGCFANRLLLQLLEQRLIECGLAVYTHSLVPTGDGGVSLGQAVCAATMNGR